MKRGALETFFLIAVASGLNACATDSKSDREDQWILRNEADAAGPVAVFLDWRYASVVFRAHCEAESGALVIAYAGDPALPAPASAPMELILDETPWPMETEPLGSGQQGRLTVSPDLAAAVAGAEWISIWADNEMDEPWYTGRSAPLRDVVEYCAAQ